MLLQIPLDLKLALSDTCGFVPMNFCIQDSSVCEPHRSFALALAPPALAIQLPEAREFTNAGT